MFRVLDTLFVVRTKSLEDPMTLQLVPPLLMRAALLAVPFAAGCNPEEQPLTDMHPRRSHMDMSLPAMMSDDLAMMLPQPPRDLSIGAGADLAAPQGPLPLVVDNSFAASGYEGGGTPAGTITDDQSCPLRAGEGRGHCHHVQWTPGTSSWGGVVWQAPANNWGMTTGLAMASGFAQVRFFAWGKSGGEAVSFLSGLGAATPDQFQHKMDVTLGTQPRLYVLGVRGAYGANVISGFGWVTGAAAAETFYIDDIVWTGDGEGDSSAPPSFAVDTKFGPSGYMGDGTAGFVSASVCQSPIGDASCHRFDWNPNRDGGAKTQGWAGVFWQSAPGDWAGPTDPAGAAIASGFREVRFSAWSASGGGEDVKFLAGMGATSKDGFQSTLEVHLKTTPTTYSLGVGGGYGNNVAGGLGWTSGNGGGLSLAIDGATWR
jgi:hypothetical protein